MANDTLGFRYAGQWQPVESAEALSEMRDRVVSGLREDGFAIIWVGDLQFIVTPGIPLIFQGLND